MAFIVFSIPLYFCSSFETKPFLFLIVGFPNISEVLKRLGLERGGKSGAKQGRRGRERGEGGFHQTSRNSIIVFLSR